MSILSMLLSHSLKGCTYWKGALTRIAQWGRFLTKLQQQPHNPYDIPI